MSYFSDNGVDEEERRNNAFKFICAIREAITIAKRMPQLIPYKRINEVLHDFSPDLQKDLNNLLTKTNESDTVRYYKQKANLLTKQGKVVDPIELIQKDISENKELLDKDEEDSLINRKIYELEAALEYFTPEPITENQLLNHDFSLETRDSFFHKKIYSNEKVKDYALSDHRILRLRLLHPDKAEHIIGADLIYEQFDVKKQLVRFIHLQYKTWNSNVIYFSQGNMKEQMDKLDKNICQSGFCADVDGSKNSGNFRFPYCSAFLRPTSKIEKPDSKLLTTGDHIPICSVRSLSVSENKLTKENIKDKCVSHKIFEELFITNLLGSRWMTFDELDKFYKDKGINSEMGRIRVHAQEILGQTDEQINIER